MRWLVLTVCVALASCGARSTERPTTPRVEDTAEAEISGVSVIARDRAGSGHVAAGLSVRVRADPPALATAAALVIEERSHGRLVGRASADGITLRTTGPSADLESITHALASALRSRDVTPDETSRALGRIRARRAGRAADDRARAARLAVAAMFGAELDALGTAEDDEAITSARVSDLLRTSFGVERALVAFVGDVRSQDVEAAVARTFGDAPHVTDDEAPAAVLTRDVRVEISERDVIAVARRVSDLRAAERAAGWVAWADPEAVVSAFPMRGSAILVAVRDAGADDLPLLVGRTEHASQLEERVSTRLAPDAENELTATSDAWLARTTAPEGDGLGIGVVAAGTNEDDEARAVSLRAEARTAIPTAIDTPTDATEATLASGARVRVRRVAGGSLAVAIGFSGGSSLDPRTEHGRAALVAELVRRSCEPDAEATWVDARTIGVVVAGEPETLERTVARAVDCVRRASREAVRADGIRAELIATLDDDGRARAWAASAIAPATPGLVAPRGSAAGIAAISGLDTTLRAALAPDRATFVVLGDVDPARALTVTRALAEELGRDTAGPLDPRLGAVATSDVFTADPIVGAPLAILTLRADGVASATGARASARAIASALTSEGVSVAFWLGDAARGTSFVAVGVRGDDALLDSLPERMATRLATLDPTAGLDEAVALDARRRALASPLEVARELASGTETADDPRSVALALLHAAPRYVMVRPSPGPLRPPRRR